MYIISEKMISTFCPCSSSSSFEEAYLNNNDLESLCVKMYHYRMGNGGIIFLVVHVLLIVISPINVL